LGGGEQVDGDGSSAAGDGFGVGDGCGCGVGEFGVLVDDDDEGRRGWARVPDAGVVTAGGVGAGVEHGDRVGEQSCCLGRGDGEPGEAGRPRPEFHAAFEVDSPEDDVGAGGEVAEEDVEDAALAGVGGAADEGVSA
jgi:hypothetical protein